jgi:hypothetical protein
MVEMLNDFQNRDIFAHSQSHLKRLGNLIFTLLSEIRSQNKLKGCFFTHYNYPLRGIEPHVKVGIRYNTIEELENIKQQLDDLCQTESSLIRDPGKFNNTPGNDTRVPKDVVVDYIICHSFEWVVKIKQNFNASPLHLESLCKFILQNKNKIENKILGPNVFRDNAKRALTEEEIGKIWERFIHHLCNACSFPNNIEYQIIAFLRKSSVNVYLNQH